MTAEKAHAGALLKRCYSGSTRVLVYLESNRDARKGRCGDQSKKLMHTSTLMQSPAGRRVSPRHRFTALRRVNNSAVCCL